MNGNAPAGAISPQTRLALGVLAELSSAARQLDAFGLSAALDARPDQVGEVASRLAVAGWIVVEPVGGRIGYRAARVDPEPNLYEVIHAVEGASVADDCALGLGPCGALTGRPVCRAHESWLRQLAAGAMLAAPLVGAGARLPRPGTNPELGPGADVRADGKPEAAADVGSDPRREADPVVRAGASPNATSGAPADPCGRAGTPGQLVPARAGVDPVAPRPTTPGQLVPARAGLEGAAPPPTAPWPAASVEPNTPAPASWTTDDPPAERVASGQPDHRR